MTKNSESSHAKNGTNLESLISVINAFGPVCNPSKKSIIKEKLTIIVLAFAILVFNSCSKTQSILGDWGAINPSGNYSKLYFSKDKINIHDELGGTLQFQTYQIENDSLMTSILKYKMNWINADSLNLVSNSFLLKLKRIKTGLKLSEYNNEKDEDAYLKSFYDRMYKQKWLDSKPVEKPNSDRKIEEEVIEIGKKK